MDDTSVTVLVISRSKKEYVEVANFLRKNNKITDFDFQYRLFLFLIFFTDLLF